MDLHIVQAFPTKTSWRIITSLHSMPASQRVPDMEASGNITIL
jgi:hypothetical protein